LVSAYILGDAVLARLISATHVRLSLVHGNVESRPYGYVTHAITVGQVRRRHDRPTIRHLALRVNERFNDSRGGQDSSTVFHAHVNLWRQPMQTCIRYAREACRSGLETAISSMQRMVQHGGLAGHGSNPGPSRNLSAITRKRGADSTS